MTAKPINNRAWFFVLPVLGFVLFSSIVPTMTVVNYSVQDTMGANNFFWNGDQWFRDLHQRAVMFSDNATNATFRILQQASKTIFGPDFDILSRQRRGDNGAHDRRAGLVALHAGHARPRVGRLQAL